MPVPIPPSPMMMKKPQEQIGLIQGIMPDSINEWYVSLALDRLGMNYMYQYAIYGGASTRGGQTIDFVVFTPIGSIPVYVQGTYWHNYRNDPDRIISLAEAARYFKTEPVELWEYETDTREKALTAVRTKVQV